MGPSTGRLPELAIRPPRRRLLRQGEVVGGARSWDHRGSRLGATTNPVNDLGL